MYVRFLFFLTGIYRATPAACERVAYRAGKGVLVSRASTDFHVIPIAAGGVVAASEVKEPQRKRFFFQ